MSRNRNQNAIFLGDSRKLETMEIPKILENVFIFLDLPTLKTIRSVNYNWCLESSRILQKSTTIKLHEEEIHRNNLFQDVLLPSRTHPLPFRYLDIDITKWSNESIEKILSHPELQPKHIQLRKTNHKNKSDFSNFLGKVHQMLTSPNELNSLLFNLSARVSVSFESLSPELNSLPFKLFTLQDLSLVSDVTGCYDSLDFVLKLLDHAPRLRKLYIMDLDPTFLNEILERGNLRAVEELESVFLRPQNFGNISNKSLPKLKVLDALIGFFNQLDADFYSSNLPLQLLTGISKTIEELQISWNLKCYENSFPFCPELRILKIRQWGGSLGAFSSKACPRLEELNFSEDIVGCDDVGLVEPNSSVKTFILMCTEQNPQLLYTIDRFHAVLEHISVQFPCLKNLEIAWAIEYDTVCLLVKEFGRKLESLTLDTRCGFTEDIFTGFVPEQLEELLKEGKDLKEMEAQRKTCLIDMKNLRKLTVTCRIYDKRKLVNNNCIEFGVQGMTNLEEFRLDWNTDISMEIAGRYLCHLKIIEVLNMHEFRRCQTLTELKEKLPQVVWRKRRVIFNHHDFDDEESWDSEDAEIDVDSEDEGEFDPDDLDIDEFLDGDLYDIDMADL